MSSFYSLLIRQNRSMLHIENKWPEPYICRKNGVLVLKQLEKKQAQTNEGIQGF